VSSVHEVGSVSVSFYKDGSEIRAYVEGVELSEANLPAFALGCAVASSGGGGDTRGPLRMARQAVGRRGPVPVVGIDDLPPDGLVLPCGLIGSPTVATERVWGGEEADVLLTTVEALTGAPVVALMCYEIAGANGLLPVAWAADLGLPILDADGMGRAFPEMQQQAMHLAGVAASPVVLTDSYKDVVVVSSTDNRRVERLARRSMSLFGGTCAAALYRMTARQARGSVIQGSVSRALHVGRSLGFRAMERVAAIADAVDGTILLHGKIVELQRQTGPGFAEGSATVEGVGGDIGRLLRLELQNEVLLAMEDGEPLAVVPDIISVISSDSGHPLPTEGLHGGQRVVVVAHPGPAIWTTEAGLEVVGPGAFGLRVPYSPIARQFNRAS
jgi:DUF917 family protein